MHVFLAGATGVIGRRLIPRLTERGHRVTAMTRHPGRAALLRGLGAEPVVADAFARGAVVSALLGAAPDAVIHQLTDLSASDTAANARLRIHGTRNLVDAARIAGVERMVAQSIAWAYAPGDGPATEDVPLDLEAALPRQTTVEGVAALEAAVAGLPEGVVLRYGLLYGPGTWFAAGGAGAENARAGRLAADDDVTSFLHVDDAAAAAAEALDWPPGPVNVCDDEPAAGRDWVPALCAELGAPTPAPVPGPGVPWARGADNGRARRELGWSPRHPTWRDGFVRDLVSSAP